VTVYETALSYASAGIYVNPVYVQRGPDGKKQVRPVGRWREMSTISKADIYAWWGPGQPHEHAGILIDCGKSNLVVVDPDGPDGVATWLELFDGVPPIPLGVVNTPRGGQHWYYWAHPDHPIGNDQDGKVAPKVDVRGLGGLAIAPPTQDGTGTWEWVTPPQWHVEHVVPDLVIERMTARKAAPAPAVPAPGDDLFDDSQREFTEQQAIAFVKAARVRLAQTTQGFNGAINNFAMACAHFPWRVDRDLCAKLMIETLKPITGWTEPDLQDRMTINSAYAATEAGRSWVAVKRETAGPEVGTSMRVDAALPRLHITSTADMTYWLAQEIGTQRLAGFFLRDCRVVHTPRVNEIGYVPAPEGSNGPAEIRPVSAEELAAKLQFLYACYKVTKEGEEKAALFPVDAGRRVVNAPESATGLRPLAGITLTPMVRADGSVLDTPGYDKGSGYLFLPGPGVSVRPVPSEPSADEVRTAVELLNAMVAGFPFDSDDDRANYFGLLLTPLLRLMTPPSYKLFGIGAHQPGSGKSLLAQLASEIHGGVLRSEVPQDEAEWSKQIGSILSATSAPVVVLDNVTGVLKSSALAGMLTAGGELSQRELGKNANITYTNDRVWVVTGNNLSLGGDLVRRTITVMIDPDSPNPEQRTDFAIPDLAGWVQDHRNELLWSLLVLVRNWVVRGEPEKRAQSDSYARWEAAVGGILAAADIAGRFDAESGKRAAGGGDDDGLAVVLEHLVATYAERSFSVAEALALSPDTFSADQRDWVPGVVLDRLARSEPAGRKSLGHWMRNRLGRWVTGTDGRAYVIREVGRDKRGSLWKVEVRG